MLPEVRDLDLGAAGTIIKEMVNSTAGQLSSYGCTREVAIKQSRS